MSADDPLNLIDSLDPEQIRGQIADLENRRSALVTLLRAARARSRKRSGRPNPPAAPAEEVARAE